MRAAPTSTSKSARNSYGAAYEQQLLAGVSSAAAFAPIDGLDSDCDGLVDAADPVCAPPPAASDYDIAGLAAPATATLRVATSVSVTVLNAGTSTGGATLRLVGVNGRKSVTLADNVALTGAAGASQTLTFPWKPNATGTFQWTATIADTNADDDAAAASTAVGR